MFSNVLVTVIALVDVGCSDGVTPPHCTTVSFSMAEAVTVKVETMSATLVWGLVILVRTARKPPQSCIAIERSMQFTVWLIRPVSLLAYEMILFSVPSFSRNGSAIHSRRPTPIPVQVYVTTSPGQARLPSTVEVRVTVAKMWWKSRVL